MFIDEIKKISRENKKVHSVEKYREKVKSKLLFSAKNGLDYCKVWLPYGLDLTKLNEALIEDGIDCVFLESNLTNTKYKVYISERMDSEKFKKLIEFNRKNNKK